MYLIAIAGALDLIAFLVDLFSQRYFDRVGSGQVTAAEINDFDTVFGTVSLGQTVASVATAFVFLAWLSRIVENIPTLGAGKPSSSPRASIVWWFVPIAQLVKPYLIVRDLYRRLAQTPRERGDRYVLAWWILFAAGSVLGGLTLKSVITETATLDDLRLQFALYAGSDVLTALSAPLAIVIIRRMQRWADGRAAALRLTSG